MLTVYCNQECINPNLKARIIIKNNQVEVDIFHRENEDQVEFVKENHGVTLQSYSNYVLNVLSGGQFHVKRNHKVYRQSIKFYPIQRIALSSRSDYSHYHDLLPGHPLLQVDTGVITETVKEMAIKVIAIPRENLEIEADIPYELVDYSWETQINPRFTLWDRYAVVVDGVEYQADHHGAMLTRHGNTITFEGREFVDVEIRKYNNGYQTLLERSEDGEEVVIECSAGLINAQRVYLQDGRGTFRLYPFGYQGKFKLKLGWRWYPTWCEYNLEMR